jgi:hypothetical protein
MSNTVRYDDTGKVPTALRAVNELGGTPSGRVVTPTVMLEAAAAVPGRQSRRSVQPMVMAGAPVGAS